MRKLLLSLALLYCFHIAIAGDKFTWGDFPKDYLAMKTYSKDTSAAAVVLLDYGTYNFTDGYETDFLVHERIKILKTSGFGRATVSVPYDFKGLQKAGFIRASSFVLNDDGTITESKVQPEMIFDEDIDGEEHLKKFTIPNVKVGCVIEYKYTIHSPSPAFPPDWIFEATEPVLHGEFHAEIPAGIEYAFLLTNPLGYVHYTCESGTEYLSWQGSRESVETRACSWMVDSLMGFKEEDFMTSPVDYISKLTFHLKSVKLPGVTYFGNVSWDEINDELVKEFFTDKQMSGKGYINKVADSLVEGITDSLQRMQVIYDYVRENMVYTNRQRLTSMNELNKVLKSRKGDLGDFASILTLMLRDAGLRANLAITSTWKNGYPQLVYPSIRQFDYLLTCVKIDTSRYFLDATDPNRPWKIPPKNVTDRPALLIDKDHWDWAGIAANGKMQRMAHVNGTITAEGKCSGDLTIVEDGYAALNTRDNYKSTDSKDQMLDLYGLKKNPDVTTTVTDVKNIGDPNLPITSNFHFENTNEEDNSDVIYFSPVLFKFMDENPFKSETRNYNIDFGYLQSFNYIGEFVIPDNYKVDELPQNILTKLPDNLGVFKRLVQVDGSRIDIVINVSVAQSHFDKVYYSSLRTFYDKFISAINDQVVLKKKN